MTSQPSVTAPVRRLRSAAPPAPADQACRRQQHPRRLPLLYQPDHVTQTVQRPPAEPVLPLHGECVDSAPQVTLLQHGVGGAPGFISRWPAPQTSPPAGHAHQHVRDAGETAGSHAQICSELHPLLIAPCSD